MDHRIPGSVSRLFHAKQFPQQHDPATSGGSRAVENEVEQKMWVAMAELGMAYSGGLSTTWTIFSLL